MDLKPGSRWKSAVCDTQIVVVRPPKEATSLECGGYPVIAHSAEQPTDKTVAEGFGGGTQAGKRFADDQTGLEVLCTKAGAGTLTIEGREIGAKEAKKLPASD